MFLKSAVVLTNSNAHLFFSRNIQRHKKFSIILILIEEMRRNKYPKVHSWSIWSKLDETFIKIEKVEEWGLRKLWFQRNKNYSKFSILMVLGNVTRYPRYRGYHLLEPLCLNPIGSGEGWTPPTTFHFIRMFLVGVSLMYVCQRNLRVLGA